MNRKEREAKAIDILLNDRGVDYIIESFVAPDFVECVCSMGGDTLTFRVYDSGAVTER